MFNGLGAGVLWALDTVILGIALSLSPFASGKEALFLAPFVSTFLHDTLSALWMLLYMSLKRQVKNVIAAARTRSGRFVMLGALLGGPVGMSGYVIAISLIGPAYTSVISAFYPALGALFSYIFLKEKMSRVQVCGLAVSVACIIGMAVAPGDISSGGGTLTFVCGFACAVMCAVGWGLEAVICSYGMRQGEVSDEQALQIRQIISSLTYGVVILPIISGYRAVVTAACSKTLPIIALAALFGTTSYVMYYRAIKKIGPTKAMSLNITYAAWSVVFSAVIVWQLPEIKDVILGAFIILGSLTASNCILRNNKKDV